MSVKELVDSAVSDNSITIFSKSYCPYCKKAKKLFAEEFPNIKPVIFELDEVENGSDIQTYLYEKTGQRTVPNVFVTGKHIGGSDSLEAAHKKGTIAPLLTATSARL